MAHNGGKSTKSYGGRNNNKPSGKHRDNWRVHKVNATARRKARLERIASTRICSKCMHVAFRGRRELIRHELRCKGVAA